MKEYLKETKVKLNEISLQKRGGKGIIIYKPNDIYGNASCGQLVSDEDMVLLIGNKNSVITKIAFNPKHIFLNFKYFFSSLYVI